jgi:hypothetical protein
VKIVDNGKKKDQKVKMYWVFKYKEEVVFGVPRSIVCLWRGRCRD